MPGINSPIRRYMTGSPVHVEKGTPLLVAVRTMKHYSIRHLPVLDQGVLVGVITNRDIVSALADETTNLRTVSVEQIMNRTPYSVTPETPLKDVAAMMAKHSYGSAVILEKGRVVGIFTVVDALRALHEILS